MADLGAIGASYGAGGGRRITAPVNRTLVYRGASRVATAAPGAGTNARVARGRPGPKNISIPGTPSWYGGLRPIDSDPIALYGVGGTVKQRLNGVDSPIVGCLVRLYARRTGMYVGAATTAVDGSFLVPGLLPESQGFFAVAFDPDGAPVQNALIFDRLQALPSVPGEIRSADMSFIVGQAANFPLKSAFLVGAVTWAVTSGALPAGVTLGASSGVVSGTPTEDGPYSFTVTATGATYGSGSRSWSGETKAGVEYLKTLQGNVGLQMVRQGQADEGSNVLPALPFAFNLFGVGYQNNIYVCANSYVSFGFGNSVYSGISPSNPGRALLLGVADRGWKTLYAGPKLDNSCYLIRFEGGTTYYLDDSSNIWEVGLYSDGAISVVTGPFPTDGVKQISDGLSYRSETAPDFQPNRSYLGKPTGTNGNFVWEDVTP